MIRLKVCGTIGAGPAVIVHNYLHLKYCRLTKVCQIATAYPYSSFSLIHSSPVRDLHRHADFNLARRPCIPAPNPGCHLDLAVSQCLSPSLRLSVVPFG
jgi:hypothetical protein